MKKKPEEKVDEDWMATYGDMVTLLLCFFVMMASVSKPDIALFEQIQASMNDALGNKDNQRPIELMMADLDDDIKSVDISDQLSLGSDTQGVVLEMEGDTFFNQGSADLSPIAIAFLKRVAAPLQSDRYKNFKFSIEGHTSDEKLTSSQFASNWELSAARAAAVVRFLESRGIPRVRMQAVGLYDVAPKYPNMNPYGEPIPENRRRNRRVVIHIEPSYK